MRRVFRAFPFLHMRRWAFRPRRSRVRRDEGGFTLLELLLYMGGFALVAVGLVAMLILISDSWLKSRTRALVEENARIAVDRMRVDAESGEAILWPTSTTPNGAYFTLDSTGGSSSAMFSGYAWSENLGWVSFNCTGQPDPWDCDQTDNDFDNYGVTRSLDKISGMAMTGNNGFISFDCLSSPNTDPCANGSYQVTIDAQGNFHGWAWGDQIGWISFNCADRNLCGTSNYKVYELKTPVGADIRGYAWSENYGWISFNCLDTDVALPCDPVNYKVIAGLAGTRVQYSVVNGAWTAQTGAGAPQNLTDSRNVLIEECSGWPGYYFKLVTNPAPARPDVEVCYKSSYRGIASTLAPYSTTTQTTLRIK